MGIVFNCHACGSALSVGEELAGKQARCGRCKRVLTVPATTTGTDPLPELPEALPDLPAAMAETADPLASPWPAEHSAGRDPKVFLVLIVAGGATVLLLAILAVLLAVRGCDRPDVAADPEAVEQEVPESVVPPGPQPAASDEAAPDAPSTIPAVQEPPAMKDIPGPRGTTSATSRDAAPKRVAGNAYAMTELGRAAMPAWPAEDVAWSVEPDPPSGPERPYSTAPIPLGLKPSEGIAFTSAATAQIVAVHSARGDKVPGHEQSGDDYVCWLSRHDLHSGRSLGQFDLPERSRLLAVSPNGKLAAVLVGVTDERVDLWSLDDGRCVARWHSDEKTTEGDGSPSAPHVRRHPEVLSAVFADDEHLLLAGSVISLWKVPECRAVYRFPAGVGILKRGDGPPLMTPGGRYLLAVEKTRLRFLDPLTGAVQGDLPSPMGELTGSFGVAGAIGPDAKTLAVIRGEIDYADLVLWDLASGKTVWYSAVAGLNGSQIEWCGERRLLVGGGTDLDLVDLDLGVILCCGNFNHGRLTGRRHAGGSWVVYEEFPSYHGWLATVPNFENHILSHFETPIPSSVPMLLGPGASVSLEVGSIQATKLPSDFREKVEAYLRESLEWGGTQIASGASVRLVATCQTGQGENEEFEVTNFMGPNRGERNISVPVYTAQCRLALTGRSGEVFWDRDLNTSTSSGFIPFHMIPGNRDPVEYMRESRLESLASRIEDFFMGSRLPGRMYRPLKIEGYDNLYGLELMRLDVQELLGFPDMPDVFRDTALVNLGDGQTGMLPMLIRLYIEENYLDVLADDEVLQQRLAWCPAAKSPSIGVRGAIAVEVSNASKGPRISRLEDLKKVTGVIGTGLVSGLQSRLDGGKLGEWSAANDPRTRALGFLGVAERDELFRRARGHYVDFVVVINLVDRGQSTLMRVRIPDLSGREVLWVSKPLDSHDVGVRRAEGEDLLAPVLEEALAQVDALFALTAMPSIQSSHVEARLTALEPKLTSTKPLAVLAALSEIRYYQATGLVTAEKAAGAYDLALGEGEGEAFAGGPGPERRKLLTEWLTSH